MRTNSILEFTITRYVIFFLILARGFLIPKFLGPDAYGVFGFLILAQQYLVYAGLGVQYAINVELATYSEQDDEQKEKIISTALSFSVLVAFLLLMTGVCIEFFSVPLFEKYNFADYSILIFAISGLSVIQQVLMNICRVYQKLRLIAAIEFFTAITLLLIIFFFREDLLSAILVGSAFAALVSIFFYMLYKPFALLIIFDHRVLKKLLTLGVPLLIFSAGIVLIYASAQTITSAYYPVVTMGYYSFATGITAAVLLGVNTIMWVIYPDMLSRSSDSSNEEDVTRLTEKANIIFNVAVFIIIFLAMLFAPAIFWLLPEYRPAYNLFNILLLSQGLLALGFGYSTLAIARRKQLALARLSFTALAVVIALCIIFGQMNFPVVYMALSVLIGSLLYSALLTNFGTSLINRCSLKERVIAIGVLKGSYISVGICVLATLLDYPFAGAVIGALMYLAISYRQVVIFFQFIKEKLTTLSRPRRSDVNG